LTGPRLADSLEVVAPSLPRALVEPEMLARVRELGAALAPVPRCGFEVRLGGSARVDVQQWITTGDGEPERLRDHLSELGWRRLDEFLAWWSDSSSSLHREVAELWLELDQPAVRPRRQKPGPAALPPLSVFFGFPPEPSTVPGRLAVVETVLDMLLGGSAWSPWRANVRRCFEACPENAFISHVGVMLGRPAPVLRINVKRLGPGRLKGYLQRAGWSDGLDGGTDEGALDEAAEMMAQLHRLVDHITVGLDVGAHVHPRLGLECGVTGQPPAEPRWAVLLDEFVERGWCTAEKRDALLEWPGSTTPANADAPWPAELIHDGLLRPQDHFSVFTRQLGHVKVTYEPGRSPEAKAYFGFFHGWRAPAGHRPQTASARGAGEPSSASRDGAARQMDEGELTTAITEAVAFLVGARTDDGWWRDFSGVTGGRVLGPDREWITTIGASDEWVTAFVAVALAAVPDPQAHQAARDAWQLLVERRRPADGWGYNGNLPVDADSTAWGLRLAQAVGMEGSERARDARRVLEGHLLSDGGVAAYREQALVEPPASSQIPANCWNVGWCHTPQPCVTAGAAALPDERPRDYLRRAQRDDGSWKAYWWEDEEYTTAFAADALARTGRAADRRRVRAAIGWATERIGPNGADRSAAHGADSAFATALCVRILALSEDLGDEQEQFGRAVTWLLKHQRPHGAWSPSARLFAPRPHVSDPTDPDAPALASLDEAGVFTTATVLPALAAARSRLRDPAAGEA
jgi:hypothetical protein